MWYKVAGDANHNDTEARKVTSTISMRAAPVPAEVPPVSAIAHVQRKGTLPAVSGGKPAGTTGKRLRMESIRLAVDGAPASAANFQGAKQAYGKAFAKK